MAAAQRHTRDIPTAMRKKRWVEAVICRLPAGTTSRIEKVLGPTENQSDLLRTAIEKELAYRETKPVKRKP